MSTARRAAPFITEAIKATGAPRTRAEITNRVKTPPSLAIATGRPGEYACGLASGKGKTCDQFEERTMPLTSDDIPLDSTEKTVSIRVGK